MSRITVLHNPNVIESDVDGLNSATSTNSAPRPVALMDIAPGEIDPRKTVLGNRFLCIGGSMLFVGPSGIGKSSASVQQDVLWSLGREAFGILPARPLRILTIQAENDAEDLAEMRDGVCRGLNLTTDDQERVRASVFYVTENRLTGLNFLALIESLLAAEAEPFDLVRIDPFLAYLGGDVNSAEDTGSFLRNGLNPILSKHRCACILNHHTPKVTNRDTSNWRGSDWMYAGAGSADITNWCRAAVVIDPTHADHVFSYIAAKRGGRIGWVNEHGEKELTRLFCHSSDGLYWRAADAADIGAVAVATAAKKSGKPARNAEDMLALVPMLSDISKVKLLSQARGKGFTQRSAPDALAELIADEKLFVRQVKRPGTNAEQWLSRQAPAAVEIPSLVKTKKRKPSRTKR